MIFRSRLLGTVEIHPSVVATLTGYRQRPRAAERGGVLAGCRVAARAWLITHASPPSARSLAGLFWLKRDRGDAQRFIDRVFAETRGVANYLGEWHTHPQANPSPSTADRRMLTDLLANSRLEIDFLFGAIVGTGGNLYWWCQTAEGDLESFTTAVTPRHRYAKLIVRRAKG